MRYTDLDKNQLAYLLSMHDSRVNNCTVAVSEKKFAGRDRIDLLSNSDSDPAAQVSEDDLAILHRADLQALALADEADAEFLAEEKAAEKNRENAGQLPPTQDERMGLAYDVLVRICGAHEDERDSFLRRQAEENHPREWRFSGSLGFGGKFWRNSGRLYVSCYKEDETPNRLIMIAEANRQFALFQPDPLVSLRPLASLNGVIPQE